MKHVITLASLFLLFAGAAFAAEETNEPATDADASAEAEAESEEDEGEKFPVSGSANVGYRVAASQLVGAEGDDVSFGSQVLTFGAGLSYSPIDDLSLTANLGANKQTVVSSSGAASTSTLRRTELTNVGLGAGWAGYKIPVLDIQFTAGVSASLPTSRAANAVGLIFSVGENIGLSWSKWDLSVNAGFSHAFNLHDESTAQIPDEARFSDLIKVAGQDLGTPHTLHSIETNFGLGYKIIGEWSVNASYFWTNGFSSTLGKDDEFTTDAVPAQTGLQMGLGSHGTSFSTGYAFPTGTSVRLGMSTAGIVYTTDNKEIFVPVFDTQSNINHRTNYSLSVSQPL